jgi:hypothetical protein
VARNPRSLGQLLRGSRISIGSRTWRYSGWARTGRGCTAVGEIAGSEPDPDDAQAGDTAAQQFPGPNKRRTI